MSTVSGGTTSAAPATTSATDTTGTNAAGAGSGNAALQASFQDALAQAQQTLTISTTGQANLNALRARPQ